MAAGKENKNKIYGGFMKKGKSIYFSKKELEALLEVLEEWENIVDEDIYSFRLKLGLGTAWGKLSEAKSKTVK